MFYPGDPPFIKGTLSGRSRIFEQGQQGSIAILFMIKEALDLLWQVLVHKSHYMKWKHNKKGLASSSLAIVAALGSSLCCIVPVLALLAGVSGMASSFSWLSPLSPYLGTLALIALAFAWYREWRSGTDPQGCASCAEGEEKRKVWRTRAPLILSTLLVVGMLGFPYYSGWFLKGGDGEAMTASEGGQELVLKVEGMTCTGCEKSIEHALGQQDGVLHADAEYEKGRALVRYRANEVEKKELVESIEKGPGYEVTGTRKR
ncbi:MAG: mercuric transporter MerT family protein [Flavobacteriales bacterium]